MDGAQRLERRGPTRTTTATATPTFLQQLTWVVLAAPVRARGGPAAAPGAADARLAGAAGRRSCCSRSPRPRMGVTVNGNQNWLALGPIQIQPSELAKLAVILWCADVYATQGAAARRLAAHADPGGARSWRWSSGWSSLGHDLGTALVLMAIVLGMLWVVGAPTRLFVGAILVAGVGRARPRRHDRGAAGAADQLRRPVRGLPGRRVAGRARHLRDVQRRPVRQGHRRQPAEVGRPAGGAHRLHLRGARRGARPGRHAAGARPVPHPRLRRAPGRRAAPRTRSSATWPPASRSG